MKTVLAALDLASDFQSVFDQSTEYALRNSARLRFVYMLTSLPPNAENWIPVQEYDNILDTIKADYIARLERVTALARERGIEADHRLLYGQASAAILEAAQECSACIIIIGHRHHGALHELFGPSTTRGVLKTAPMPILVVPDANSGDGPAAPTPRAEEPFRFIGQT